jgi:hypothetical protein
MIERRLSKRFAQALPIAFLNEGREYRGVSMDFSASGLFILTREPFKPGTMVKMNLEVSKKKIIRLVGVVVRTMKTGDINIKDGMAIKLNEVPFLYHKLLESIEK